jgi:hypothetical protein
MGLRQPGQTKQPLPEYEAMKRRTQQRLQAEGQTQQDALQRKLATVGNLNSGAAIKAQQTQSADLARVQEDAMGQIDVQEAAEGQRRQEVADAMAFQSTEAQKGRDFQGTEAQKGRDFTGGMFDKEFGLKGRAFDEELRARQFQEALSRREFDRDSATLDFTKAQAVLESGKAGEIENLLSRIGGGEFGGSYSTFDQGGAMSRKVSPQQSRANDPASVVSALGSYPKGAGVGKDSLRRKWERDAAALGYTGEAIKRARG